MFVPSRVLFREEALHYELGSELLKRFREEGIETRIIEKGPLAPTRGQFSIAQQYLTAKRTLLVAVRKELKFQTCKPSADYQLPLVTSCPGLCEYCYLQTTLGPRPYVTVYVNVEEILARADHYIKQHQPRHTTFEAGAVGDPLPVEPYTAGLAKAISFFAAHQLGALRVATKFDDISSLLDLNHGGRTHIRFSVSPPDIVRRFERGTPDLQHRLRAARALAERGYPIGLIVAPIFLYPGWDKDYDELARLIASEIREIPLTLEFISHRFTARAKALILARSPGTALPMNEEDRVIRRGQFGYRKYVYPAAAVTDLKKRLTETFLRHLPTATVEYFV
ncbi:MAG TPA: spore photoproduct lyase [Firmicutes bacterium]|nr:spore photoproduct lyase [Bacillota bacterium]